MLAGRVRHHNQASARCTRVADLSAGHPDATACENDTMYCCSLVVLIVAIYAVQGLPSVSGFCLGFGIGLRF